MPCEYCGAKSALNCAHSYEHCPLYRSVFSTPTTNVQRPVAASSASDVGKAPGTEDAVQGASAPIVIGNVVTATDMPVFGPWFGAYQVAASALRTATAEIERLRAGIQAVIDGGQPSQCERDLRELLRN